MIDKNDALAIAASLHKVEKAMKEHHKLLWRLAVKNRKAAKFDDADFMVMSGGTPKDRDDENGG